MTRIQRLFVRLGKNLLASGIALASITGFSNVSSAQNGYQFVPPTGTRVNSGFQAPSGNSSQQIANPIPGRNRTTNNANRSALQGNPRFVPASPSDVGNRAQLQVPTIQPSNNRAAANQANVGRNDARVFRSYQITKTSTSAAAKKIRAQMGDLIEVVDDSVNQRILVNASVENHRMVQQIVNHLQGPSRETLTRSHIKSIRSFNVAGDAIRKAANELSRLYVDKDRIVVAADEMTGKLMVFSTEQDYEDVARYLKENGYLGRKQRVDNATPEQRTYRLNQIDWRQLETAIFKGWGNQLKIEVSQDRAFSRIQIPVKFGPACTIQIDRRNNLVQIDAAGRQLIGLERLVKILDRKPDADKVSIIRSHTDTIDQVQATVSMFKFAALQQEDQPKTTSAILGKAKNRKGIYAIYQDQNQENSGTQGNDDNLGPIGRVEIITIPGTDIIILKGDPDDVERVRRLIQQIEKSSEEYQPQIEVVPLTHVDNIAIQAIASEVYTNFYQPILGQTSFTALVKPNAVLLVGTPQGVKQARELIERLDVAVESKTEFRIFRIKHMSAVDLENRLRAFYLGQSNQGFGANAGGANNNNAVQGIAGDGLAPRLRLASDYRSNSLFVHAAPRDMEEIARFIEEVDVDSSPDGPVDHLKIIRLKNSVASELAPVLQDVLNGQLQGAGRSNVGGNNQGNFNQLNNLNNQQFSQIRSAMLALQSLDPSGKIVKSGILFGTRITADENSNSLIIKANQDSMQLIELLVQQLDQLPDVESRIKVFELENAAAPQVVETIQNLFNTQQGGGNAAQAGGTNTIPLETGGYKSTIVNLRLAADARSNTVIAAGSQGDLNIIEALVTRLDEDIESAYVHRVYRLQNVTADVVQDAITGWLDGRSETLSNDPRVQGSGDGSLESVKRAITVQAETETNSLIVSAHKEYIHIIENIIRDIDFKKQVVIQAVIAEVQLADTFEFGIEWGVQDSLIFDRGLGGTTPIGFPFNQAGLGNDISAGSLGLLSREDFAGQVLSNLSVGRTNADVGYGGLVVSAGNESINVLLRALDDKSKVDILSRPQITTMENIQAFVQVGQDLPYVTGVDNSNTAGGTTTFATDFLELGVTLSVTPRVRPDGEIWMRVDVSNSSVADGDGVAIQTTAAGGVVFQPIINDQTLQTDVTARSGQTIVLGGLIQSTTQNVVRGIPFFSSIPGIGRLFRFESEQNARSELFVILRPIVIDSPEDRSTLLQLEAERMNWCISDVINMHGPVFEDENLGGEADTVYPDRTPTGYHKEANRENQNGAQPVETGSLAPLNGDFSRNQPPVNGYNRMSMPNQRTFATEYRGGNTGQSGNVRQTSFQNRSTMYQPTTPQRDFSFGNNR